MAAPTTEQRWAADPTRSVWVDANAGTGKTRVLTDRILRLLLAGAVPSSILGLTFTKAAAGEMRGRVERRLARWAVLGDADLAAELQELLGTHPTPDQFKRAGRLFDEISALPAGLRVMTIHGLAQWLLHRFPVEAGVAPHYSLLDERSDRELELAAERDVFAKAISTADVSAALAMLIALGADDHWLRGVRALGQWHRRQGKPFAPETSAVLRLAKQLRIEADVEANTIWARVLEDLPGANALAAAAADLEEVGNAKQKKWVRPLRRWLAASPAERVGAAEDLLDAIAKRGEDGWLPKYWSNYGPKLQRNAPETAATILDLVERLGNAERAVAAVNLREQSLAMLRLGRAVADNLAEKKRLAAALDFDDLIARAAALLEQNGVGDWVRFKLDQGVDHLLVDEAQDTSPAQWRVIEALVDDFFSGLGADADRRLARTLFVVGDEKQSIYGFQGADLATLRSVRSRLAQAGSGVGRPIENVALATSFRSAQAILDLVDAVLTSPAVAAGLGQPGVPHRAADPTRPGQVELWPLLPADEGGKEDKADPWAVPPQATMGEVAERRVAQALAGTVREWLRNGTVLAGHGRPITPGDVMVLLRKRGTLQDELVRAFKRCQVPVLGADRLLLTGHLAVMDLVALGEAALLPDDDFALACALKSPAFDLAEDELFRLAQGRRPGERLSQRLRRFAGTDRRFADIWQRFSAMRDQVDFVPPYDWYLERLSADGLRQRILARFGDEALEPIEAFLAQALLYERGHPASLKGFLHWLQLSDDVVKREMEAASHAVRVLTVHGAKGLEAPIVFLADAGYSEAPNDGPLLMTADGLPLWRGRKDDRLDIAMEAMEQEAAAEEAEDSRRLYVAMTRAATRLIILGRERSTKKDDRGWHGIIDQALETMTPLAEEAMPAAVSWPGKMKIYRGTAQAAVQPIAEERLVEPKPQGPPDWLRAPPPAPRAEPLAATDLERGTQETFDDAPSHRNLAVAQQAVQLGQHLHRLLERCNEAALADPNSFVALHLQQEVDLSDVEADAIRTQVTEVLQHADFRPWFVGDVRAEQRIVGVINGQRVVGQLDRLVVFADKREAWIGDFKSGRPPAVGAPVPDAYLKQMAVYRHLVRTALPGFAVRCALLWTEAVRCQWLDEADLDAYMPLLGGVTAAG